MHFKHNGMSPAKMILYLSLDFKFIDVKPFLFNHRRQRFKKKTQDSAGKFIDLLVTLVTHSSVTNLVLIQHYVLIQCEGLS